MEPMRGVHRIAFIFEFVTSSFHSPQTIWHSFVFHRIPSTPVHSKISRRFNWLSIGAHLNVTCELWIENWCRCLRVSCILPMTIDGWRTSNRKQAIYNFRHKQTVALSIHIIIITMKYISRMWPIVSRWAYATLCHQSRRHCRCKRFVLFSRRHTPINK